MREYHIAQFTEWNTLQDGCMYSLNASTSIYLIHVKTPYIRLQSSVEPDPSGLAAPNSRRARVLVTVTSTGQAWRTRQRRP